MSLTVATEPMAPAIAAPAGCRLVVLTGPGAGHSHLLEVGRHVIGRDGDADLSVADPHLSRRHFELLVDEALTLVDLGSSNGVTVNGLHVARARLRPGAIIEAGAVRFVVLPPVVGDELPALDRLGGLRGASDAMRGLYRQVLRAAASDATVLVRGESGVGKEAVATAIHELSTRSARPMVVCDLAAINHGTFESDLFGHVRGAFTGAVRDTPGLVRAAHGGTALLDEIGELSPENQAKLLRLVERREVRAVGEVEPTRVDVRLIATTLRPLEAMVAAGRFRLDLLHRLSVVTLTVPPLRERLEDLGPLARHLIADLDPDREWALGDDAVALLGAYPWPGNVRELRNVLQRVISQAPPPVIDLGALVRFGGLSAPGEAIEQRALPFHLAKELVNDRWERAYLLQLVQRAGGNLALAAHLGGLSRVHVYRLLRKHQLAPR